MFEQIAIGSMVWNVLENDDLEESAPTPLCMAARAEMLSTWYADLAAHRSRIVLQRARESEVHARADAVYDAAAAHMRAHGLAMM